MSTANERARLSAQSRNTRPSKHGSAGYAIYASVRIKPRTRR